MPALVTRLLDAQRELTAVERFAQRPVDAARPAHERYYRDLIPLSAPGPGEQYAFAVDLDACTGCKACVTACHSLNGLDDTETWRQVGVLVGGSAEHAVQQTVTTACHHCEDPGCLRGCPVGAYDKDTLTGIVRHLDDQCIGCQYCVLMCPYEVPQYSPSRGIVRKCDLCHGRLAVGEAPACVQACPSQAITVRIVARDAPAAFPPDTPDSRHTQPTTRYLSARGLPTDLEAADRYHVVPAPAHPPLVLMLTLTELAVGIFVALAAGGSVLDTAVRRHLATGALGALLAGLAASVLHLGQPAKAWRVFLGLRTSWMSREILAFGALVPLALSFVGSLWAGDDGAGGRVVAAVGLATVGCSVMIYHATGRTFWRAARTGSQLLGTTALLGATALLAGAVGSEAPPQAVGALVALVAAIALAKMVAVAELLRHRSAADWTSLKRSALLLTGALRRVGLVRVAALVAGSLFVPAGLLVAPHASPLAAAALACAVVGELTERWLFFAAVAPPRMPGVP